MNNIIKQVPSPKKSKMNGNEKLSGRQEMNLKNSRHALWNDDNKALAFVICSWLG